MEKTVYRVYTDSIEFSANKHIGSKLVGKPFPRNFSEDEIREIYFTDGNMNEMKLTDYDTEAEAIEAAKKVSVNTEYHHYNVGYIRADIVTVEEVKIDDDGEEEWTGMSFFRAKPYEA